jgi:uncharacterized protein YodC (DUF2158 family)
MAGEQLKPGDVVNLKSGGPKMTVTAVGDNYGTMTVWCAWFDGKKKLVDTFAIEAVELAK